LRKPSFEPPKRELKISHPADGLPRTPKPAAGELGVTAARNDEIDERRREGLGVTEVKQR